MQQAPEVRTGLQLAQLMHWGVTCVHHVAADAACALCTAHCERKPCTFIALLVLASDVLPPPSTPMQCCLESRYRCSGDRIHGLVFLRETCTVPTHRTAGDTGGEPPRPNILPHLKRLLCKPTYSSMLWRVHHHSSVSTTTNATPSLMRRGARGHDAWIQGACQNKDPWTPPHAGVVV